MTHTRRLFGDPYRLILLVLMIGYGWLFFDLAVDLHIGMRTHKADLGQIDQAIWNSSRGRLLQQTDNGYIATRLSDHVEPILVLVSPLLRLWNHVAALLWLQTVFVALGAWLLYDLVLGQMARALSPRARQQVWQVEPLRALARPVALALAVAYLLTPQLQSALLTEFHAAPLAVPLILWAFWAVENGRRRQFVLAALLVAAVKEEMALLAAGLGIWAIWRAWWGAQGSQPDPGNGHAPKARPDSRDLIAGALVALVALLWFVTATFVIVPAHAVTVYGVAESGYFQRYGALGDTPLDIARSLLTQPDLLWQIAAEPARREYLIGLLAPFGLLSLLAPEILLLSLPALLANLLSAYPAQYYGEFHYSAPLVPYLAAAAALGIGRLWRLVVRRTDRSSASFQQMPAAGRGVMAALSVWTNARTALRPLLAAGLVLWILGWAGSAYTAHGRGPLAARYDPTPITSHHRLLTRFVAQIPPDAAVTATAAVHPHVSHRRFVYQFPMGLGRTGRDLGNADWALLDVTTNTDMAPGDLRAVVEEMLAGGWGVVDGADGFLLLARSATAKSIPDAFFDFARTETLPAALISNADPTAAGRVAFLGYTLDDRPRWRQSVITSYWRVDTQPPAVTELPLELRTPNGDLVGTMTTLAPPALVWYTADRWRPGEILRVASLPMNLPKTVGVVTHGAAVDAEWVGAHTRVAGDRLVALSSGLAAEPAFVESLSGFTGLHIQTVRAQFDVDGRTVNLVAALPDSGPVTGQPIDLWLQWREATGWPSGWTAFVHLRRDGVNVAQNDGTPRLFVNAPAAAIDQQWLRNDWRQLVAPGDAIAPGLWSVVVGLYEPTTGARAAVIDATGQVIGNEVEVGRPVVGTKMAPDQACALLPESCAAQTLAW